MQRCLQTDAALRGGENLWRPRTACSSLPTAHAVLPPPYPPSHTDTHISPHISLSFYLSLILPLSISHSLSPTVFLSNSLPLLHSSLFLLPSFFPSFSPLFLHFCLSVSLSASLSIPLSLCNCLCSSPHCSCSRLLSSLRPAPGGDPKQTLLSYCSGMCGLASSKGPCPTPPPLTLPQLPQSKPIKTHTRSLPGTPWLYAKPTSVLLYHVNYFGIHQTHCYTRHIY